MYSSMGMFGETGVRYQRVPKGFGGVGGESGLVRLGHYTVGELNYFLVCMLSTVPLFIFLRACAALGKYQYGIEATWVWIHLCETIMVNIAMAFTLSTFIGFFFVWRGLSSFITRKASAVLLPVVFVSCVKGDPVSAATVASAIGVFSWWRNRSARGGHLSPRVFFGFLMFAFLVAYSVVGSLIAAAIMWYLVSNDHGTGTNKGGTVVVDQSAVKVNNAALAVTEDVAFAQSIIRLKFDDAPSDVMRVCTHVPITAYDNVEFRRWSQLGDVLMSQAVVLHGFDTGQTVATISSWKQTVLTRSAMMKLAEQAPGYAGRLTSGSGMFAHKAASEMIEALVGVAWYYGYRKGTDVRWSNDVTSWLQERMGLFRHAVTEVDSV